MSAAASSSTGKYSNVPPRTANFTETWAFLSLGVDQIMTNPNAGLAFPEFSNLYTALYYYCTLPKSMGTGVKPDANWGT